MTMIFDRAHRAAANAVTLPAFFAGSAGTPIQNVATYDSDYLQPSSDVLVNGAGTPVDPRTGVEATGATRPEQ